MGFSQKISATDVRDAILDDATRFSGADIAIIDGKIRPTTGFLDFWGDPKVIGITTSATTFTLEDVVIPNITGLTPTAAYALLSIDGLTNTNGSANGLDSVTYIQVDYASSGWINAIENAASALQCAPSVRSNIGMSIVGSIDISSYVAAFNRTINFRWQNARAEYNNLNVTNIRPGVRVMV